MSSVDVHCFHMRHNPWICEMDISMYIKLSAGPVFYLFCFPSVRCWIWNWWCRHPTREDHADTHTCTQVVSHINASWHISMSHSYVKSPIYMWYNAFILEMTHSYMWHDWFLRNTTHSYLTLLIYMRDMTHSYLRWLIHTWYDAFIRDTTHSYVTWRIHTWHDAFIRDMTHSHVTWLIHMWHDSFICDTTHSYVL